MKPDIDFEEQQISMNKMLADMKHDLSKEHHWEERAKSQDNHWKYQKFIWGLAATIAIITAVGAPFLTEYAKYIFHIENNRTTEKVIEK